MTAFTDTGLRALEAPEKGQKSYWDDSLRSFGIRVSRGSKTFILKRKNRWITIGRYPLLSLSQARTEAKKLLAEFTLGRIRPQSLTYKEAVALYLEDKAKNRRARTLHDYARLLARVSFGQLADITHDGLAKALKPITAPSEYNHLLVALRIFFNWCIKRRYITHNPTSGLSIHSTQSRARVLTDEELKKIWQTTDKAGGHFGTIIRLLILLGSRRGEIAALRWSWIKDDRIEWPPEVMKNGESHWLPLLPLTKSIIKRVPNIGDLLFPARGKETPFNGWSKSASQLWTLSGVEGATLHDIRRSWTTHNAAWAAPHILERALSHVSGTISGVAALYNRFQYEKELIDCYQQWERRIAAIVENGP